MSDENFSLTIGMPVFNGEEFLESRIKSILNQSFSNFKFIISDNNSTDSSALICQKYEKEDSRIRFFQQKENIGDVANFKFVLDKANTHYFVWAAADDKWDDEYLQKTIDILEKNDSIVGCTSDVKRFGKPINEFSNDANDSLFMKQYKNFRRMFRQFGTFSVTGNWHKKAEFYMRHQSAQAIYCVFRRKALIKSFEKLPTSFFDMALIMSILQHGDIYSINETLWFYRTGGTSSKSILKKLKDNRFSFISLFLSPSPFVKWMLQKFGFKFLFKNLDYIILLYLANPIVILMEIFSNAKGKN